MTKFLNVLKAAASYTVCFVLLFTGFLWTYIFLVVTINAFWKFFATMFLIAVAVFTWDAYNLSARIKALWKRSPHKPSIIEGKIVFAK